MNTKIFSTQVIKYQREEKVGFFKPKTKIVDKKRYETIEETFQRIINYIKENNISKYQIIPIPLTFDIEGQTYNEWRISGTSKIQQIQFYLIYED